MMMRLIKFLLKALRIILLVAVTYALLLFAVFGLTFFILGLLYPGGGGDAWSIEEIERELPVPLPDSAANLTYVGQPRAGYLALSFEAPPDEMLAFIQAICPGDLIPGFDPFRAIYMTEPYSNTQAIHFSANNESLTVYVYSPDTSAYVGGIVCGAVWPNWGFYEIALNTANPTLYRIELVKSHCNICNQVITANLRWPFGYESIRFWGFDRNPLDTYFSTGVAHSDMTLQSNVLCIGLDQFNDTFDVEPEAIPIGSQISISINGSQFMAATVGEGRQLIQRQDADGEAVSIQASGTEVYYCQPLQLDPGRYTLTASITGQEVKSFEFVK